ncbi:vacuolar protein sorting-associated protein 72 homolog [Apostichopus japonicus]|uniref:vacuolar protein sorting-associated protein 72 homolog n=1 Tax=Stichopus japonicus TaxID=307972 RepID=UPI003AB122C0
MSLAATREKRGTAGNRMQRMLDEEQEDDFYKTTYGGFQEESGDEEFSSGEEEKPGDESSSDSDISASEDDEVISEEDDDAPKRAKRVVTKAYKEPVKQQEVNKAATVRQESSKQTTTSRRRQAAGGVDSQVRKSSRRSTVQRVNEFQRRIKEREEKSRHNRASLAKKAPPGMRRLTQEELLREARITEKHNLASLKVYQQMEAEKKKVKIPKRVHVGPKIRFHSLTMPLIVELPSPTADNIVNVVSTGTTEEKPVSKKKCSRNFITLSDEKLYPVIFPKKSGRPPTKLYCPVTRMPAKYIDPVTSIPYATKKAFKIIRETYSTEIENAMMDRRKKQKKAAKT